MNLDILPDNLILSCLICIQGHGVILERWIYHFLPVLPLSGLVG